MANGDLLFESIFKRDISSPGTRDFLAGIVNEYPYFTPAHFYLLEQTEKNTEAYKHQAAKTSLLFNNPLWLNYKLAKPGEIKSDEEQPAAPVAEVKEDVIEEHIEEVIDDRSEKQESFSAVIEKADEKGIAEALSHMMNVQLPDLSAPVTEDTISFEPLHTTDYFASQGIKLSEEVRSDDKLGKNLKSFTEWLKTMKKIHPENMEPPSAQTEVSIQQLAEKSNTENEVVTEAMADVLIQQGKRDKAIEVYQKLSLLNPLKSAYFAAKINNLKGK